MPIAIRSDRTDDLRVQALQFLVDLHDLNMPPDEAIGLLCVLAEQFQPGATVGGSIIDSRSASSFDRAVFPSMNGYPKWVPFVPTEISSLCVFPESPTQRSPVISPLPLRTW